MSSRAKGNQTERKAVEELEKEGWLVYRVKGSTKFNKNVDIFSLFDILAICKMHGNMHRMWIQVKTNSKIYGKNLKPFVNFKKEYCDNNDSVEIWSWWGRGKRKNKRGWDIKII